MPKGKGYGSMGSGGKKGKLSVQRGAVAPKSSWGKSVSSVPQGSSAPGPHWGHQGMIPHKSRIKGHS